MDEATQALADRDWWQSSALPGWRLHGWTYRQTAVFVREDGTGEGMPVTGEMATEIIRLRAGIRTARMLAPEQADQLAEAGQRARLESALRAVHRQAQHQQGDRTFDQCMTALMHIDDLCRAVLAPEDAHNSSGEDG